MKKIEFCFYGFWILWAAVLLVIFVHTTGVVELGAVLLGFFLTVALAYTWNHFLLPIYGGANVHACQSKRSIE
jgi:hypothetical protein